MKKTKLMIIVLLSLLAGILPAQEKIPSELFKKTGDYTYALNDLTINTRDKTITINCKVNMISGLIEVVLCRPEGKTHESLLVTNTTPLEFNTALLLLGLDPVNEIPDDPKKIDPLSPYKTIETPGDSVFIFLETESKGTKLRKPVESYILDKRNNKCLTQATWLFRGAVTHYTNHVVIDNEVTMIGTYHDIMALMELNEQGKYDDELFYVNESTSLTIGQNVTLILQALKK